MIAIASEAMQACGAAVGDYAIRVNTRQLLDGVMQAADVTDPNKRLIVLRALDKMDRLGVEGVSELLGGGRKDESGDFTEGAGLSSASIDTLLQFAQAGRDTRSENT